MGIVLDGKEKRWFLDNPWDEIAGSKPSNYYFLNLLANAGRRADLEHKFDDAETRICRAIEGKAQIELQEGFHGNAGKHFAKDEGFREKDDPEGARGYIQALDNPEDERNDLKKRRVFNFEFVFPIFLPILVIKNQTFLEERF